jgi:aryl-alcohol dehydrogenase-like predicted oxidoreductase
MKSRTSLITTKAAIKISGVLEKISKAKNTQITSVALAYVMQKTAYVFPIVGGRKIEHLKGNIEGLSLELSDEEIAEIEGANAFDIGFPYVLSRKQAILPLEWSCADTLVI